MTLTPTDLLAIAAVVAVTALVVNAITLFVVWKLLSRVADRLRDELLPSLGIGGTLSDAMANIPETNTSTGDRAIEIEDDRDYSYKDEDE